MTISMFSIIGEALHFGGRRLGLIARVAWLPVILLMTANMASVFASLSVIAGRPFTFADVSTFVQAQQLLDQYAARGWSEKPGQMAAVLAISVVAQIILVSSFMAPLTRYAGLGERPAAGIFRMPFGADQLRFIVAGLAGFLFVSVVVVAPIAGASFFVMQHIVDAMSQTMASFPNENSLHTIEIVSAGEGIIERGTAWIYDLALPLAAAAPFGFLVWLISFLHFHPRNRAYAGAGNFLLRGLATLLISAGVVGFLFYLFRGAALEMLAAQTSGAEQQSLAGTPVNAVLIFAVLTTLLVVYFQLRLFPYPGVAVCRGSLGLAPALPISRGWNLFRLAAILVLVAASLLLVTVMINVIVLPLLLSTVNILFQATEVSVRLVNSGASDERLLPAFVWGWNVIQILINLIWTFFSYGVIAALYGRLYRESERLR
ncbi:MAG: hypothetical protein AAGD92_13550 [Pseudomonadota bacterium]